MPRSEETTARPGDALRGPAGRVFQSLTVSAFRTDVAQRAARAGLDSGRTSNLVLAVNEVAVDSVSHGRGWGTVRLWEEEGRLVCEVAEKGAADAGAGRPEGYGVWLAERLCDDVTVLQDRGATVVRLSMAV